MIINHTIEQSITINYTLYAYSKNLLRLLLNMKLITEDEYKQICTTIAEHYDIVIH